MALARRDSRRIVVGGRVYRWKVRRRPTYSQANGWTPLIFAVEPADRPASRLVVQLPGARPDNWLGLPGAVVTPGLVARCIADARAAGWDPSRGGIRVTEAGPLSMHRSACPDPGRRDPFHDPTCR